MSDDEKIGEIRIEEHFKPFKGHKYLVFIRLKAKIDPEKLTELVEQTFLQQPWTPKSVEAFETKKQFPKRFDVIWQAIAEVEKTEIPPFKYQLRLLSDEPAISIEDVEIPIAEMLENEKLVQLNRGGIHVMAQKVQLFSYERPRTIKRIPLTRGMLKQALGKQEEKSK